VQDDDSSEVAVDLSRLAASAKSTLEGLRESTDSALLYKGKD